MFLSFYFYTQAKPTHSLINTDPYADGVALASLLSCSCVYVHTAK